MRCGALMDVKSLPAERKMGKNVPGGGNSLYKGLEEHKKARSQDSGADSSWSRA